MSSIPQNKSDLLEAIQTSFDKLNQDYADIPDSLSRTIGVEGNIKNSEISVCDTLAYLIGWGKLVLKWHKLTSNNMAVDFPESGYQWNELGQLASHFYAQYHDWSYGDLLTEFQTTTEDILTLVESLSNDELYAKPWYKTHTLGRMIQFNTSSPMKNVRTKVRKFKRQRL